VIIWQVVFRRFNLGAASPQGNKILNCDTDDLFRGFDIFVSETLKSMTNSYQSLSRLVALRMIQLLGRLIRVVEARR